MRHPLIAALTGAMGLGLAVGCARAPMAPIEEGMPAVRSDQATRGGQLFAANCSKCHGNDGKGTKEAPAVVGQGALPLDPPAGAKFRKGQFRTAKDVLEFVKTKMPADNPGSLSNGDYEAILAFDLKANGVELQTEQVSASNAATYVLHP
jgi:cytochrome c